MFICDLFEKHDGSDLDLCYQEQVDKTHPEAVRYVSRTAKNNGISAYIKKTDKTPCPGHVLSVACGGSVLSTFYQDTPFYSGQNIRYLVPKKELSVNEMIFYAMVIEQNKYKYNYGRHANRTLEFLEIPSPEEIPEWVYTMEIPTYDDISDSKTNEKVELPPISEWKSFKYDDLFDMKRGQGPSATEAKHNPGNVPYIGASAENNGITLYSSHEPQHKGNVITIATDGSVGEAFYQKNDFNSTSNIAVITLKDTELTPAIAMFLVTLIKQEQYKFNYGRKWGITRMKESIISLPVNNNDEPDWDLMERYINSLPYSKYL